jgi:restriction endonuclease S subunit
MKLKIDRYHAGFETNRIAKQASRRDVVWPSMYEVWTRSKTKDLFSWNNHNSDVAIKVNANQLSGPLKYSYTLWSVVFTCCELIKRSCAS